MVTKACFGTLSASEAVERGEPSASLRGVPGASLWLLRGSVARSLRGVAAAFEGGWPLSPVDRA